MQGGILAAAMLLKCVDISPRWALAKACRQLFFDKAYEELELLLAKAVQAEPLQIEVWFWLAMLAFKQSDFFRAYRSIEQVCRISPRSAEGFAFMGRVLDALDSKALSEQVWRQAVYLDPLNEQYRQQWSVLLRQVGKGEAYIRQTLAEAVIEPPLYNESDDVAARNNVLEAELRGIQFTSKTCVIIPVYDDYASVCQCLISVIDCRTLNQNSYDILVINDASPDRRISVYLNELKESGNIILLENRQNLGFIRTVNKGLAVCPDSDVILLNADTVVFHDWVDRLCNIARNDEKIASVTPFSNNAQLFSFPRINFENVLVNNEEACCIDSACVKADTGEYPEVPTGIGFCLYLRRSALDQVGYLDDQELLRGYGEEVDLCQRFRLAGWKNVCATNTFVAHLGGKSFKHEKRLRVVQNQRILNRRYPDYEDEYRLFSYNDPLKVFRQRVEEVLLVSNTTKYKLIIAPENGYLNPFMEKLRFECAASAEKVIWLYHAGSGPYAGRGWVHLNEDAPMGFMNLSYQWPSEMKRLQAHLHQLKIEETWVYCQDTLCQPLIHLLQNCGIKYDHLCLLESSNSNYNDRCRESGRDSIIARSLPRNRPVTVAVSGDFTERKIFECFLKIVMWVSSNDIPLTFWSLQHSLDDMRLLRSGKVSFAMNEILGEGTLANRLSAAGVTCLCVFEGSLLFKDQYESFLRGIPVVKKGDSSVAELVSNIFKSSSEFVQKMERLTHA